MTEKLLNGNRIIPVVVIENDHQALPLADAIIAGGMTCVEITLRTSGAFTAIKMMAERGDLLVGAGTVFTPEQARKAVDHGAQFIVSPGISTNLLHWCLQNDIAVFPGCATPTDLQLAMEEGLTTVKFFPAEQLGGIAMLKTLGSVFRSMHFMPTGGINAGNVGSYLALKQVAACGGSWMVPPQWLRNEKFDKIREEVSAAKRIADLAPASATIAG